MNTITINVTPELAYSFEKANKNEKKRVELYINTWLNEAFSKNNANERLFEIMKKSSIEAKQNGYNPDMLENIVNDLLSDDKK